MNFAHIWMICFLFNFKLRWFLSCWSFILNFFFIKFKWQFSRVHKLAREWDRNFTWKIELKLTYGGATVKFVRNFYGLIDYFEGKTNDHFDLIYMRLRIYPNDKNTMESVSTNESYIMYRVLHERQRIVYCASNLFVEKGYPSLLFNGNSTILHFDKMIMLWPSNRLYNVVCVMLFILE